MASDGMKIPGPITATIAPLGPHAQHMLNGRREARLRLMAALTDDIAAGIRVLRDRDGADISEAQIDERARNIVTALVGNYLVTERP